MKWSLVLLLLLLTFVHSGLAQDHQNDDKPALKESAAEEAPTQEVQPKEETTEPKEAEPKEPESKKPEEPEQKEPEQKEPEQKEPEQKEPEQKEPEQKEPKQKEPEQKEPEQKEPEQEEPEQEEPAQKEPEQKEPEQKEPEPKGPEDKKPDQKENLDTNEQIAAAAEKQDFQEPATSTSHEIDIAPVAKLNAGTGDIDTTGPCSDDIVIFCMAVRPGYAHIAECLSNEIADEEEGVSEYTAKVTGPCKKDLIRFKMDLATNINMDVEMAQACKRDAKAFCEYTKDLDFPGKVIACLREKKSDVSGKCAAKITAAQIAAAEDYRLDAPLYDACHGDAESLCKDVEPGTGRMNACLHDNRQQVSWDCQQELFRADVENSDDIRFSVRLFQTCLRDKRTFCADVPPGNAHAKDCLERNRDKSGFTKGCRVLLEKMIEDRARDFRLDTHLRKQCAVDIETNCAREKDGSLTISNKDSRVVECLQDFRDDLSSEECHKAVVSTMERAADDIRFSISLAEACYEDRTKFCANVEPGSARVIRCLQDLRGQLSDSCQATLFDHEVRMSESIDFNKPMKEACVEEVPKFCNGVTSGNARVIWCLQQHKDAPEFGKQCRDQVTKFEKDTSQDYRLNRRLATACEEDIGKICSQVCENMFGKACGGRVLRCLVENKKQLKHEACKQEVFYFIKMDVTTFGNDIILAEACRDDVGSYCENVKPGNGRVHECLRDHREQLSTACRKEELKLEIEEASNIELRTSLTQACSEERQVFCSEVRTGQARVFRCLVQSMGKSDFGETCKTAIVGKLQRRQQNWKLDVSLRRECAEDVQQQCSDVDHDEDKAAVTRCLIDNHDVIKTECQREVSRAAYMSLFVWQGGAPISKVCDEDINRVCLSGNSNMAAMPGRIIHCLAGNVRRNDLGKAKKKPLSDTCKALLTMAEPPDEKTEFDLNLEGVAARTFTQKLSSAGMWDHHEGFTITGLTAVFCFSALCTTILMGLAYGYKRWRGIGDVEYQQVVKSGDV